MVICEPLYDTVNIWPVVYNTMLSRWIILLTSMMTWCFMTSLRGDGVSVSYRCQGVRQSAVCLLSDDIGCVQSLILNTSTCDFVMSAAITEWVYHHETCGTNLLIINIIARGTYTAHTIYGWLPLLKQIVINLISILPLVLSTKLGEFR